MTGNSLILNLVVYDHQTQLHMPLNQNTWIAYPEWSQRQRGVPSCTRRVWRRRSCECITGDVPIDRASRDRHAQRWFPRVEDRTGKRTRWSRLKVKCSRVDCELPCSWSIELEVNRARFSWVSPKNFLVSGDFKDMRRVRGNPKLNTHYQKRNWMVPDE